MVSPTTTTLDLGRGRSPLHAAERIWPESNCYIDVWIELLHALGCEPVAMLGSLIGTDFDGDQWPLAKPEPSDLRDLYGIDVAEMNIWRPLEDHIAEHLDRGRLLTVEVDSYYLPDTAGDAYQRLHQKSTIVPTEIDRAERRLAYFHNATHHVVDGDDYDGVIRRLARPDQLVPYVETIRLDGLVRHDDGELARLVAARTGQWRSRRPAANPVTALGAHVESRLDWLGGQSLDMFHLWAFSTLRQVGGWAELLATFVRRYVVDVEARDVAATALERLAQSAKALQFRMARIVNGRTVDVTGPFAQMAADWETATSALAS